MRVQLFSFLLLIPLLTQAAEEPALKTVFKDCFRIGAALNPTQFYQQNTNEVALIKKHFNTITPENVLKWESVHPSNGVFKFEPGDRYVAFGEANGMFIIGHTLIWHSQTPRWVFQGDDGKPASREVLLSRMKEHISTVVGHYKGKVRGWDVVNEALYDDGRLRQSPWLRIVGEDYLQKAFEFAHEADPQAELYYNDYWLEKEAKRKGAIDLIKNLQKQGIPIAAVGLQGHYKLDSPTPAEIEATISEFAALGIKVMITELDVDVLPRAGSGGADIGERAAVAKGSDPYKAGLPQEVQEKLAKRYSELFGVFVKHRKELTRVTFWGVTDGNSWLNDFPIRGRTNYPLLFDRQGRPKPALQAVIKATP